MNKENLTKDFIHLFAVEVAKQIVEILSRREEPVTKEDEIGHHLISAKEAAEKLGVVPSTLWRWNKTGYLKKVKVGNSVRYRLQDVINLINN